MKLPPPADVIKIAAVTALGAAQIAKISGVGLQVGDIVGAKFDPVPGSGIGDKVPAMLEPGEFVVNKRAAEIHLPALQEINSAVPRFQVGGVVPERRRIAERVARVGRAIPDIPRLLPAMPDFQNMRRSAPVMEPIQVPAIGNLVRRVTEMREITKQIEETREVVRERERGTVDFDRPNTPTVTQVFQGPTVFDGITMSAFAKRTGDEYTRLQRRRRGFRGGE